ncbi:MAG: hypothetical protein M5U09_14615 [Gammaproteobacteria bacterium]|nr:hypothetical protein [Gammaproteobacteria bacterium]
MEVPGDRLWIDPAAVVGKVLEQLGPPRLATISRAVTSGFTPLPYRFVGDHVRALLAGDHEERSHFGRLFEIATGTGERTRLFARPATCSPRVPTVPTPCSGGRAGRGPGHRALTRRSRRVDRSWIRARRVA